MGYWITRGAVTDNMELLEQIKDAVAGGTVVRLSVGHGEPSTLIYHVRQALKSAEFYGDYGFRHLCKAVTVSATDGQIIIKPRSYAVAVDSVQDEMGVIGELVDYQGTFHTLRFRPTDKYVESGIRMACEGLSWDVETIKDNGDGTLTLSVSRPDDHKPERVRPARRGAFDVLERHGSEITDTELGDRLEEEFGES